MITFNYTAQTSKSIDLDIKFPFYIIINGYDEDEGRYTCLYKFSSQDNCTKLKVYDDYDYKCIYENISDFSYNERMLNEFIEQNYVETQEDNINLYDTHIKNLKNLL
jgi:hypothetical protein